MNTEAVSQVVTQVSNSGGILAILIPPLVQILKRIPFISNLNGKGFPAYELLSIALGIAGAYATAIANPIPMGILAALAAMKGYDWTKGPETPKAPNG